MIKMKQLHKKYCVLSHVLNTNSLPLASVLLIHGIFIYRLMHKGTIPFNEVTMAALVPGKVMFKD